MINVERASEAIRARYPDLEPVSRGVYKAIDSHDGRPYAVRYFDLSDEVPISVDGLRHYQDAVLGKAYFDAATSPDLRSNHYLYFVASSTRFSDTAFINAKALVEADREYARKIVVSESALDVVLARPTFGSTTQDLPPDALSIWSRILEENSLQFVVDDSLKVPAIVKHIADGSRQGVGRFPTAPQLEDGEIAASDEFLKRIEIHGFRPFPKQKDWDLASVNLVSGVNGVGKTSFLEAIEFLFCRQTKRTEKPILPNTAILGTWRDSGKTLRTTDLTSPAKLRARHLDWYGKTELKKLTLDDSFGKFNFLDTDAAVRLSVDNSDKRITEDLFQLLLGAESSKALDRLQRVAKQLDDTRKSLEKDIAAIDLRRSDALRRAEEIRRLPQESDELFKELIRSLVALTWQRLPDGKGGVSSLAVELQDALTSVRVLIATDPTKGRLADGAEDLARVAASVATLLRDEQSRQDQSARAHAELQRVTKRLSTVKQLLPIVRSGLRTAVLERNRLREQYAEVSAKSSAAQDLLGGLVDVPLSDLGSFGSVLADWTERVNEAVDREERARASLAALESTQATIANAKQQLRSAALDVLRQTNDRTHCPVCQTEFDALELNRVIEMLVGGFAVVDVDRSRRELAVAQGSRQRLASELEGFRALQRLAKANDLTSVAASVAGLRADQVELPSVLVRLNLLEETVKAQQAVGWSTDVLDELSTLAGVKSDVAVADLEELERHLEDERAGLAARLAELEHAALRQSEFVDELVAQNGPFSGRSLVEIQADVEGRIRESERHSKAARDLAALLTIAPTTVPAALEVGLAQSYDLMIKVRTAVQREAESQQALERETGLVDDAEKEIDGYQIRLDRVDVAYRVIDELTVGQSDRLLVERVLRENATSIASTFERIHAPNEFDVVAGDKLRITRRTNGRDVDLEEMSSGQRAAYALSLFLAMNERLTKGPKLLIFDDPISHVDDINALSFLDHLREIALTGMRQIFFATADAKLAGLFVRKFSFLGADFRHIQLSR